MTAQIRGSCENVMDFSGAVNIQQRMAMPAGKQSTVTKVANTCHDFLLRDAGILS